MQSMIKTGSNYTNLQVVSKGRFKAKGGGDQFLLILYIEDNLFHITKF